MKKLMIVVVAVLLVVSFGVFATAGEKEDLALKIYVDTAVLQAQVKELQQLRKQIEANQKKLNALIRNEEPEPKTGRKGKKR